MIFQNLVFTENEAGYTGGIFINAIEARIDNSTFTYNESKAQCASLYLRLEESANGLNKSVYITDSKFLSNTAVIGNIFIESVVRSFGAGAQI